VVVSEELLVWDQFVFWLQPLGAFSGFDDLFNGLDGNVKPSGFMSASHICVEALKGMLFLEGSDLFCEMEFFASLSEISGDLIQLDFAHE
jgi:hypothetical protein